MRDGGEAFQLIELLRMNANYAGDEFREKLVSGMSAIIENDGPYLIHCTEGKDRTGFVCMLIEALCGATYDEIEKDYMITYKNYYGITKETDPQKYTIIVEHVLKPMVNFVVGDENIELETADLSKYAEQYLIDSGMTKEQIAEFLAKITK